MAEHLQDFVLTFVPLFIVIDALGNLPFVISLSEGMSKQERRKMIHVATITATVVGLVFLFFGQFILKVMGISVGAFAIAGGLILLVLSIKYMSTGRMVEVVKEEMVAVVPIGTPLTVGPATITTLLLLANQFPIYMVLISFALNMLIAWGIFMLSSYIVRFTGQGGLKAISRVFSLMLAAIAVSMIIHGLDLAGIINSACRIKAICQQDWIWPSWLRLQLSLSC
jgi:multiple antibiotic resistance protein